MTSDSTEGPRLNPCILTGQRRRYYPKLSRYCDNQQYIRTQSENSRVLLKRETLWDYPYQNEGGQLGQAFATSSLSTLPQPESPAPRGGLSAPDQLGREGTGTGAPDGSRQPVLLRMEQDTDSTGATWPHPGAVRPRKSARICDTPWAVGSSSRWLWHSREQHEERGPGHPQTPALLLVLGLT